jgi:hypothetical protein
MPKVISLYMVTKNRKNNMLLLFTLLFRFLHLEIYSPQFRYKDKENSNEKRPRPNNILRLLNSLICQISFMFGFWLNIKEKSDVGSPDERVK